MLPRKITVDMAEADKRRYKIVRLDSGATVSGTFPWFADVESGAVTMRQVIPAHGDQPEKTEDVAHSFPPNNGFAIVARVAILALLGGFALGLAGCAATQKVQMFAAGDLANAAAIAQASGDQSGAQCWSGLGPVAMATPNPQADGLATKAERLRVLRQELTGPCGGVLAQAILDAQATKSAALTFVAPLALPIGLP